MNEEFGCAVMQTFRKAFFIHHSLLIIFIYLDEENFIVRLR